LEKEIQSHFIGKAKPLVLSFSVSSHSISNKIFVEKISKIFVFSTKSKCFEFDVVKIKLDGGGGGGGGGGREKVQFNKVDKHF